MTVEGSSTAPKVLIIGRDSQVLGLVTDEVAACAIDVRGLTLDEMPDELDGDHDLIAFGSGIPFEARAAIAQDVRERGGKARFLRVYGPYAASQVVKAVSGAAASVNLAAYCRRIGYDGPLEPSLDVLRLLQKHHVAAIPFEAIDVLLDRGVDISPAAVDAKLIARRRGGYCFEQNGLFKRVLQTIGFDVEGLAASVRWQAPPGAMPPGRTHMALRVTIDGTQWLADVGFGGLVPTAPLRMDVRDEQPTGHERFRLIPLAGHRVQALIDGRWQTLYDLASEPWLDNHFEIPNWFTSTNPASHFRHRLNVSKATADARYALLEGRLTIRANDGTFERHYLDANGIERALSDVFGLPVEPQWRPVIERAAEASAGAQVAAE